MNTTFLSLFESGGIFMWPLLIFSVTAVALILECGIRTFLFKQKISSLLTFLNSGGKRGSIFFRLEGVDLFKLSSGDFETIIGREVQLPFDRMFQRLEYISAISAIAPLFGFIGTVSGMIASFQSIADANKVSVNLVAGGISEALITTGYGLIIAVVCLAAEHLFRFILTATAHKTEETVTLAGKRTTVL